MGERGEREREREREKGKVGLTQHTLWRLLPLSLLTLMLLSSSSDAKLGNERGKDMTRKRMTARQRGNGLRTAVCTERERAPREKPKTFIDSGVRALAIGREEEDEETSSSS